MSVDIIILLLLLLLFCYMCLAVFIFKKQICFNKTLSFLCEKVVAIQCDMNITMALQDDEIRELRRQLKKEKEDE